MARKTLAEKLGISNAALSRKIEIVRKEHPEKTQRAAVGEAVGVLAERHGRSAAKILSGGRSR